MNVNYYLFIFNVNSAMGEGKGGTPLPRPRSANPLRLVGGLEKSRKRFNDFDCISGAVEKTSGGGGDLLHCTRICLEVFKWEQFSDIILQKLYTQKLLNKWIYFCNRNHTFEEGHPGDPDSRVSWRTWSGICHFPHTSSLRFLSTRKMYRTKKKLPIVGFCPFKNMIF